MADSLLERARQLHEDIEQQQSAMADDLLVAPKSDKHRMMQEHRLKERLEVITQTGKDLLALYADKEGDTKAELSDISGANVISVFYDRLKKTKEYHRRHPNAGVRIQPSLAIKPKVPFSGQERNGKYLDLHAMHDVYLNTPLFASDKRCDYVGYLAQFHRLDGLSRQSKLSKTNSGAYEKYLTDLISYLKGFYERTHPLVSMAKLLEMINQDFVRQWEAKAVAAWFPSAGAAGEQSSGDAGAEEKEGVDPLFCFACNRRFAKSTVFEAHLKGKKHKRFAAKLGSKDAKEKREREHAEQAMRMAQLEAQIFNLAQLMEEKIKATISYVERKQTQTYDLIKAEEQESSEEDESSEEEEDNQPIYNPLNLPLGWDGKPIPFWLYKLHGLNHEFKCEICGDYSYWGPRAFDRHFKEWRHVYGLRCLGIPNTDHFHNITQIADATALHAKLVSEGVGGFKAEEQEEFEDSEGNVFNKKTYELLQRQGLL